MLSSSSGTAGSLPRSFFRADAILTKSKLCSVVWPLRGYEAETLLKAYSIFTVPFQTVYNWRRFCEKPSRDLLIVQSRIESGHPVEGCIIVDGKIPPPFGEASIVPIRVALASARTQDRGAISAHLDTFAWNNRTRLALFKSVILDREDLLQTEARLLCKQLSVLPHPVLLIESLLGRRVASDSLNWPVTLPVLDMLEIMPKYIAKRLVPLKQGKAYLDKDTYIRMLPDLMVLRLKQAKNSNIIQDWIRSTTEGPEIKFATQIVTTDRKRKAQLAMRTSEPPPCIQNQMTKPVWKNDDRWQLGYVINSLAAKLETDPIEIAEPFIRYMEEQSMGKHRIDQFIHSLSRTKPDRRTCASRGNVTAGITCPFNGNSAHCISQRNGKFINPLTATIADIWVFSG